MYFKPFATSVSWTVDQSCSSWVGCSTYKLNTVHMLIPPDKLVDVPIFHPRRNHREPLVTHCHSDQRQNVRVPEVLPGYPLSAESL